MPPPPPSPNAGGRSPPPSPEAPSSVMGSGSEIDPSGAMPPRRRSLRLASLSISSPWSDSSSPAAESSGKRNTRPRASKSTVEARGLGTGCSKAGAGKRKVEVLEVAVDSSLAEDSKRRVLDDRVGRTYMCLRSGSKIALRGTDQLSIDNNKFQSENLVSGGHCIEEAGDIEETTSREERFPHQQKGKGISIAVDPTELPYLKVQAETNKKGKEKLVVEEDSLPVPGSEIDMNMDATPEGAVVHSQNKDGSVNRRKLQKEKRQVGSRKEADRSRAIELAPKFAFFKTKEDSSSGEEEDEQEDPEYFSPDDKKEDWPGPFSTAMKIIEDRYEKLRARELNSSVKKSEKIQSRISWVPSKNRKPLNRGPPTLQDLCLKVLSDNVEEIESLDGIPDILKNKLISRLCHTRKMSSHLLGLLVRGTPTQICLSDCSWATEDLFEEIFSKCNMKCLKVVQLDMCGRCLPDYVLRATLAQYPISLPSLTAISLKGAYRLSDNGLKAVVSSAPSLSSVNLSQCSLLTSSGIITIADQLHMVLRELYIDDCQNVDAMAILPALKNLVHLEVLSVAGIHSVCDKFVQRLIPVCGSHMKKLVFSGCQKLTTASIRTIGAYCSRLCAIDLENMRRLNDSALGYLANGCRSLQKLKLRCNAFSDEAVAAFLEALGGSLTELSLNNVTKVAELTALAISHQCSSTLYSLDLSFCREMTDEALGLIVDSCSSLRILKLFGCTQVTEVFFNGHSNSSVKLIGCKGQLLDGIGTPCFDY